jgi:hypothetical protein
MMYLMQNLLIHTLSLLAQVEYSYSYSSQGQAPGPVFWICWLAFAILMIAALWKVFTKAGQPGWAAIIPIVNTYFLCKVAGFGIGLLLLPIIFFPILGFGSAQYQGPSASPGVAVPQPAPGV